MSNLVSETSLFRLIPPRLLSLVGPKQRLFSGVVIQYSFAIGELILLAFAYAFRTWRRLHIALSILSLPFLLFYLYDENLRGFHWLIFLYCSFLPESPRWLVSRGHYDRAEKLLRHIAKKNRTTFDSIAYQRLVTEERKVID